MDVTTGTIKLKGTFPNTDHKLWPGQFVRVTLRLTTQRNAVMVPNEAVQTGQNGSFVYVVKPDRTVETRPVTDRRARGSGHGDRSGTAAGRDGGDGGPVAAGAGQQSGDPNTSGGGGGGSQGRADRRSRAHAPDAAPGTRRHSEKVRSLRSRRAGAIEWPWRPCRCERRDSSGERRFGLSDGLVHAHLRGWA